MSEVDSQSRPLPEDDLCAQLRELCACEAGWPVCVYCEARVRIEAQDRALRLAQEAMTQMRKQHAQEMREEQRAAQRDARDAVAEARWQERQGGDYGCY